MTLSTGISQRFIDNLVAGADRFGGEGAAAVQVWTGQTLAEFGTGTRADAAEAIERARQAQRLWVATPMRQRVKALKGFARSIRDHREQIIRLLQVFRGLSRRDAFDEYLDSVNSAYQNAVFHRDALRKENHIGSLPLVSHLRTEHLPIGVVGIFTLADYQASYSAVDVLPIIAARNGVVQFVPAQAYPVSMAMRQLAVAAGLPRNLWQIIPATTTAVGRSVMDQFDHVTYIGNTSRGLDIQVECTDLGIGASLFMSAKNYAIVLEDADMDKAVSSIAWQAFMASGHSSIHTEVAYVHSSLYQSFLRRIAAFAKQRLITGASYDHSATFGSSYSPQRLQRTVLHTRDALDSGGRIVFGGQARPDLGPWFHEPTIVADVPDSALCYDEETYGPLLQVRPYDDLDAVTDTVSSSPYSHTLQVFSRNTSRARKVVISSKVGIASVNDGYHLLWGAWNAPARGWGETGRGVRHGRECVLQYTRPCVSNYQYGINGEPLADFSLDAWERLWTRVINVSVDIHSL